MDSERMKWFAGAAVVVVAALIVAIVARQRSRAAAVPAPAPRPPAPTPAVALSFEPVEGFPPGAVVGTGHLPLFPARSQRLYTVGGEPQYQTDLWRAQARTLFYREENMTVRRQFITDVEYRGELVSEFLEVPNAHQVNFPLYVNGNAAAEITNEAEFEAWWKDPRHRVPGRRYVLTLQPQGGVEPLPEEDIFRQVEVLVPTGNPLIDSSNPTVMPRPKAERLFNGLVTTHPKVSWKIEWRVQDDGPVRWTILSGLVVMGYYGTKQHARPRNLEELLDCAYELHWHLYDGKKRLGTEEAVRIWFEKKAAEGPIIAYLYKSAQQDADSDSDA